MTDRDGMDRLQMAMEIWMRYRASGDERSIEQLLADHEDLRDLLEPLARPGDTTHDGSPQQAPSARPGQLLSGDFQLIREIGRGGMGVVFEALQLSLDRAVAVKILPEARAEHAKAIARFKQEASSAARLEHAGIVDIYTIGQDEHLHWFAMELVEGVPLDRLIASCRASTVGRLDGHSLRDALTRDRDPSKGELPNPEFWNRSYVDIVVDFAAQVADALEHAHASDVIHRDVKPPNILIRHNGRTVLTDFGLAREQGLPSMTFTGEFAGTPYYVSPEQAAGDRSALDRRTDVFSLGVTLYEMLTLSRPFQGETTQAVLGHIISREAPDPRDYNPRLSADLVSIVMKALEKQPGHRYRSAREFAEDLRNYAAHRPVRARPWTRSLRLRRWTQREPIKAALAAVLLVATPALTGLGGYVVAKQRTIAVGEESEQAQALEALLTRAFVEMMADRFEGAERIFREALSAEPNSIEALWGVVATLINLERLSDALATVESRPDMLANSSGLRRQHRNILVALGESERASSIEFDEPRTSLEWFLAGMSVRETQKSRPDDPQLAQRQLRCFQRAVLHAEHARPLLHIFLAKSAAVARNKEIGADVAGALCELWPDLGAAWPQAGRALALSDPKAALAVYEHALTLEPGNALTENNRALMLMNLRRFEEANDAFKKALSLDPDNARILHRYALCLQAQGEIERAETEYLRSFELSPHVDPIQSLTMLALQRNDLPRAIELFERGLAEFEDEWRFHHGIAFALMRSKQLERAEFHARRASELNAGDKRIWLTLGILLSRLKKPGVIEAYERALAIDADFLGVLYNLGNELVYRSRYEEGVVHLRRAIAAEPDYGLALSSLGSALASLGETEEATVHLRRAISIDPRRFTASVLRNARILKKNVDQRPGATALFQLLTEYMPGDEEVHGTLVSLLEATGESAALRAELERWSALGHGTHEDWRRLADSHLDAATRALNEAAEKAPGTDAREAIELRDAILQKR